MNVTCDLHIHTNLSICAKPEATVEAYLDLCQENGITTIGLANHCWAGPMPRSCGWADWYSKQSMESILALRNQKSIHDIRILIGCESEYLGAGVVGMTKEAASQFDYVLIPASHFHQWGFTVPGDFAGSQPQTVRDLLRRRFIEVAGLEIATGIAHPFIPFGFFEIEEEIISGITDKAYEECFRVAAAANISVEIHHHAVFSQIRPNDNGFSSEYVRMLTIAKACGCIFHFGSDAHHPSNFKGHERMGQFAEACGITEDDLLKI